jgi:hypothetical protein
MASDSLPTPPASVTPTPAAAAAAASGSQSADAPSAVVAPATATTAAGVQPAMTQAEMLESLMQQIVASNSPPALVGTLRNAVSTPEAREEVLAGTTSTGADPLEAIDVVQHTVGALFILYRRFSFWIIVRALKTNGVIIFLAGLHVSLPRQRPRLQYRSRTSITFVGNLILNRRVSRPSVVRIGNLSPGRPSPRSDKPFFLRPVSLLAKGIVQRAEALGTVRLVFPPRLPPSLRYCVQDNVAIAPLHDLLTRYVPNLSYLTPIHPLFVTVSIGRPLITPFNKGLHVLLPRIDLCLHWLLYCCASRASCTHLTDLDDVVSRPSLPGPPDLSLHWGHNFCCAQAVCGVGRVFRTLCERSCRSSCRGDQRYTWAIARSARYQYGWHGYRHGNGDGDDDGATWPRKPVL